MSAETTAHTAVDQPRWFTNVAGERIEFDDIVHCWRIPGESPEEADAHT